MTPLFYDGALYDVSVPGTVWQDVAGTIPAVNVGDPVGRIDEARGGAEPMLFNTPGTLVRDEEGRLYVEMRRGVRFSPR